MEKVWLKSYPPGVPAEIDPKEFASIREILEKSCERYASLPAFTCMDSTITPSGLWADILLPVATHFERHDVALPWYKGHYYIHRPKVIEPLGDRVRVRLAGPPALVAEITAGALAELGLVPGAPVWAVVKATEISVLPG